MFTKERFIKPAFLIYNFFVEWVRGQFLEKDLGPIESESDWNAHTRQRDLTKREKEKDYVYIYTTSPMHK
jgi:hypothetical protein